MRSISVRALALLCLVGLAACVGSPEVVGSARRDINGSPEAPSSVIRLDPPVGGLSVAPPRKV